MDATTTPVMDAISSSVTLSSSVTTTAPTAPIPTLLLRGNLVPPQDGAVTKEELDAWIPLEYILDWFRVRARKVGLANRILVLKSETASGKSTVLPPAIYRTFVLGKGTPGVICTQPRVITATENVIEILKHTTLKLGVDIGWSTKYNKLRPKTMGILSATVGTLTQQLRAMTDEELINKYRFILIDETHERDHQTDMTLYMLKGLLMRNADNPNCPFVVLMSATFDPQPLLTYFGATSANYIHCVGETAGFDEKWDWNGGRTINNYAKSCADVVELIVKTGANDLSTQADVLVFLPGKTEFDAVAYQLALLNAKLASGPATSTREAANSVFSVLRIDRMAVQHRNRDFIWTIYTPVAEQTVIIAGKSYVPSRRVILATNVAETGLTLENLKYVIDSGYNREMEYNPILGVRALLTKPAPKSRGWQRKGRAGRKFRGVFFPLYPRYIYDRLPDLQYSQILIDDVSAVILDIIDEQLKTKFLNRQPVYFSVEDIDLIDCPSVDNLSNSIERMYLLGFVGSPSPPWNPDFLEMIYAEPEDGFSLTGMGALATTFSNLPPESIRMLFSAYFWRASILDVITIAAWLLIQARDFTGEGDAAEDPQSVADAMELVDAGLGPRPLDVDENISAIGAQANRGLGVDFARDPGASSPRGGKKTLGIDWVSVYKAGLPGFVSPTNILYKIRLLIADDFIHGIILFNAIKRTISSGDIKDTINTLQRWCSQCNVSYRTCIEFIRIRDDIIDQTLLVGMKVFTNEEYSLMSSTETTFMDVITKLKHCIYDGYRNNILIRGDIWESGVFRCIGEGRDRGPSGNKTSGSGSKHEYRTLSGTIVSIPKLFREDEQLMAEKASFGFAIKAEPTLLVYRELGLKLKRGATTHSIIADRVSTISGFVSPDLEFAI